MLTTMPNAPPNCSSLTELIDAIKADHQAELESLAAGVADMQGACARHLRCMGLLFSRQA